MVMLVAYHSALVACTVLAGLILVQVIVADLAGMKARHVPGMPVTDGHGSFFFRAHRAHANTNENLGLFVLLLVTAILIGANARWVNGLAWFFVAARGAHMALYYAKQGAARGVAFGAGLFAQAALFVACVAALL